MRGMRTVMKLLGQSASTIALAWVLASGGGLVLSAGEPPKFRTDDSKDATLPWFQVVDGQFPPPDSGHVIAGELIQVDHLNRRFQLRVDRDDSQDSGHVDLPIEADMLPYGSIYYHGAPAALQDVPLGTHLHGLYYIKPPGEKPRPITGPYKRIASEAAFTRCFRLEDDFSYHARQRRLWRIDAVDLEKRKLTVTLLQDGKEVGEPKLFDLLAHMRVYTGDGFGKLESLKAGQSVLFNITWATLYGPGRIREIWLDEPARRLAVEHQVEQHRTHVRERGLPGWVDAVDDKKQIVTITLFDGVDSKLLAELTDINPEPFGWPVSKPEDDPNAPKGTIAVSLPSLMTYDPVNDRKGGNVVHSGKVPLEPGCSGVQIQLKCDTLLEGFRPRSIVRYFPGAWKVVALPREEQFHGRE